MESQSETPKQDPLPAPPAPPSQQVADDSLVRRLWGVFRREPMLLVTSSYLFVSVIGLLDSYLFYREFDLPILEYMQTGDFFVAGLRRPAYLFVLAWTLLVGYLALWPERVRQRDPARAARIERRWWGRLLLPRRSDWWAYMGLHPETMATLSGLLVMLFILAAQSDARANAIRKGAGNAVAVDLSDAGALAGDWRLLGTHSAFVFLWNPDGQRSHVVPVESIATIRPLGWRASQTPAEPSDGRDAPAAAGQAPAESRP